MESLAASRPDPLSRGERGGDPRPARRAPAGARRGRRAARRRLDRRDHAGADPHPLRRQARPLSLHRLHAPAARTPIGVDAVRARRLRGDGGRQALRQGLVARAQPRGREAGRHPPGHRRELRAHLPPERRQHRPLHLDRLRPGRAHPARRGDPDRRTGGGPRRAGRRDPAAAAACCASASSTCATSRRRPTATMPRPRTLFEKIVARHALAHRADAGASARRATAPSCAPTGASSTSTTPAWPRTCCTPTFGAAAGACTTRPRSSCSRTTPPTSRKARRTCAAAWCPTCTACVEAQRDVRRRATACARTAR